VTVHREFLERSLLDSLSAPLLAVDGDGRIRYANGAAASFWRMSLERLTELGVARLFGTESAILAHTRRAIAEEVSFTIDGFPYREGEDGTAMLLRVQIDPVTTTSQPTELALVALWDQTRRDHLEHAATEQRVLDTVNFTVRRLAHELQNPLSGIKGAAQLLARQASRNPDYQEYATVMLRELERLERMIKSLVQQGGEVPLNRTAFNVHELLDTVIWFESNATDRVRFHRDYDPSLPDLHADRDRLHQVFLNLIRNAVEAGPEGGTVTVRTRMSGPWEELHARGGARHFFRIQIEDQGPGVPEASRDQLFTPFFTTKPDGSGIGLSLCFQIVRAHGGTLGYRPGARGGAVFTVSLPLEPT